MFRHMPLDKNQTSGYTIWNIGRKIYMARMILILCSIILILAPLSAFGLNSEFRLAEVKKTTKPAKPATQNITNRAQRSLVENWKGVKTGSGAKNQFTVIFDQGHGQLFYINRSQDLDISKLAHLFLDQGFGVKISSRQITGQALDGADALIISGPFKPFIKPEIKDITEFVNNGGYLYVMLHIGSPLISLLEEFGVLVSGGVIRENEKVIQGNALDFSLTKLAPHELTAGLTHFNAYGAWALLNNKPMAKLIAQTGPKAWVDLDRDKKFGSNDVVQSFGVLIAGRLGQGGFAVFGDDAIFQNRFLVKQNLKLGQNLVEWIKASGKK